MFKFEQIKDRVFHLSFENQYDLAMHFLRVQEFYESPNDEFRNKIFTILDFMEWYSKDHGNKFTYTHDWSGFNVPSSVINKVYGTNGIQDINKYDKFMQKIRDLIRSTTDGKYYLIGSCYNDSGTFSHEIAHATWYLDEDYRQAQIENINNLDPALREQIAKALVGMGYTDEVIDDETQAYMSTGLAQKLTKIKNIDKNRKAFINTFKNKGS